MGLTPEPYEEGAPCFNCWGEGKTFGDFPTPKYVYATFTDLAAQGSPLSCPPNGQWLLEQFPGWPCDYYGSFDITCEGIPRRLDIAWIVRGAESTLWALWFEAFVWFEQDDDSVLCNLTFNNGIFVVGGTGVIS